MNKQSYLLVVSGPSGSGKDTVVNALLQRHEGIELSVSATTRAPRQGEVDGVHYHFVSKEAFEEHIRKSELLEYTTYVDNYYGTLKSEVDKRIEKQITCVLVIEVDGAEQIKKLYPDCVTVFILPPSLEELQRRLRKRGTETDDLVEKRLCRAEEEMAKADEYDYQLVNNDYDECAEEIYKILKQRQQ